MSTVDELLERFSPETARSSIVRLYTDIDERFTDPEDGNDLLDALEGFKQRQAARLLRCPCKPVAAAGLE